MDLLLTGGRCLTLLFKRPNSFVFVVLRLKGGGGGSGQGG